MYHFKKAHRLTQKIEYDHVFAQATKIQTSELVILYRKNSIGYARLGLALSKKNVPKACQRNRLKRILRESFRRSSLPAVDIVVLARPGVANIKNETINRKLDHAWEKLVT